MNTQEIYQAVDSRYSEASRSADDGYGHAVAKSFGYSEEELAGIPKEANLGLSCGNPMAIASLREGETVVDLGSGAGFDVFLAANKVGPTGKVYGVDMNKEMLARAEKTKIKSGKDNVEFIESRITDIAMESGVADCIVSNCVINLVPEEEKQLAFNEMFRLLKPGGRLAISDILLKKTLPEKLRASVALYTGCIGGASQVGDYEKYLKNAGFNDVLITDAASDLNVYLDTNPDGSKKTDSQPAASSCCGAPATGKAPGSCGDGQTKSASICSGSDLANMKLEDLSGMGINLNEWAGSFKIFAVKA